MILNFLPVMTDTRLTTLLGVVAVGGLGAGRTAAASTRAVSSRLRWASRCIIFTETSGFWRIMRRKVPRLMATRSESSKATAVWLRGIGSSRLPSPKKSPLASSSAHSPLGSGPTYMRMRPERMTNICWAISPLW